MSKLPEELAELQALERLDISHNTFIALPPVTCRIPQLKRLLANNNSIIGKYYLLCYIKDIQMIQLSILLVILIILFF